MRIFCVMLLLASSVYATRTWEDIYTAWAATLEPGWVIETYTAAGQRCHCKVLGNQTSSSYPSSSYITTTTSATTSMGTTTTTVVTSDTPTSPETTRTTTEPTTSTTTTITTTTTPLSCDKNVVISHKSVDFWSTPNYPNSYPEDIVCTLTVTIPASIRMGLATIVVYGPSSIFGSAGNSCPSHPDYLEVSDPMGPKSYYCGTLPATQSWSTVTMFNAPQTITFKFVSGSADGGVTNGISFKIEGVDLMLP